MNQDDARDPTYVMGRSEDEARRLTERAEFLPRPTRLLFEDRASRHPAGGAARGPRRRPEGRQPGKCNSLPPLVLRSAMKRGLEQVSLFGGTSIERYGVISSSRLF